MRELLVNARALQARDLAVAGSADDPRLALDLLQARYANTLALWNSTKAALDEQLASVDKGQAIDPQAIDIDGGVARFGATDEHPADPRRPAVAGELHARQLGQQIGGAGGAAAPAASGTPIRASSAGGTAPAMRRDF